MDQHPDQAEQYDNDPSDKKRRGSLIPLFAGFLVLGIGFFSGWLLAGGKIPQTTTVTQQQNTAPGSTLPGASADWDKLGRVRDQIYQLYDGTIDEQALLEGAVKGMVNSLGDPYSQFYNAEEFTRLNEANTDHFVGIGVQVNVEDGNIHVVAPIEGSPAKEAGIQAGDVILRIDNVVYTGEDINKAVDYIRGEEGTPLTLTILRNGEEKDYIIVRRQITSKSVTYELLGDQMGFITLSQFTRDVDKDFKAALDDLRSQGARGYILDLRGNPGGFYNEAIRVASNFIRKGQVVVSTIDKYQEKKEEFSIGGDYIGTPLVVLIDVGSASSSEVLAGALKDYNAATLVGQKSYGKGIVQVVIPLDNGEGLRLTIASYYSPRGTNIHKIGIMPDIVVDYPKDLTVDNYTKEKDTQFQRAVEVLREKMAK